MIPRTLMPWVLGGSAALLFLLMQALAVGPAGTRLETAAVRARGLLSGAGDEAAGPDGVRVGETWIEGLGAAEALAAEKLEAAAGNLRERLSGLRRPFTEVRGLERAGREVFAGVYASQEDELRRAIRTALRLRGWSDERLPEEITFCEPGLPEDAEIDAAAMARATLIFRLQEKLLEDLARLGAAPVARPQATLGVRTHRPGGFAFAEDRVEVVLLVEASALPDVVNRLGRQDQGEPHRTLLACEIAPASFDAEATAGAVRVRAVIGIWRFEGEGAR